MELQPESDVEGEEETLVAPASGTGLRLICPRCSRRLEDGEEAYVGPVVGPLPRCPEHGLAFVPSAEVDETRPDPFLGRQVAGRFTVLGKLGSGAMGAVYRARQEVMGRDVALKILRQDRVGDVHAQARFEREARATSALVSPHTITVFDFGAAEDGSWFLAMELLQGETLGARLRREGHLPPRDAIRITREALKSLAEAHTKGIIHRDMKPDNLFLVTIPDEGGTLGGEICKLLDFGIAKVVRDAPSVDQLETQAGAVFGTPRYMSPEQAQGMGLDARSDLYSLSVILYVMLTGRAPFIDDDAVVVMASHITRDPPTFRAAAPDHEPSPALESIVRMGLEKSPSDRPQTAEEYILLLDRASAELELPPSRRRGLARLWTRPQSIGLVHTRTRWALWGIGLAGILIIGVFAAFGGTGANRRSTIHRLAGGLADRARSVAALLLVAERTEARDAQTVIPSRENMGQEPNVEVAPANPSPSRRRPIPGLRSVPGDRYGRFE